MKDVGFILTTYVAAFGAAALMAWRVLRRGRQLAEQLPGRGQAVDLSPREVGSPGRSGRADGDGAWPALARPRARARRRRRRRRRSSSRRRSTTTATSTRSAAKDGCEAGRRLRIQGTVEEGTVDARRRRHHRSTSPSTAGRSPVRYEGDPGGIFQECVPVVVHGRLRRRTARASTATRSRSSTPTSTRPRTATASTTPKPRHARSSALT